MRYLLLVFLMALTAVAEVREVLVDSDGRLIGPHTNIFQVNQPLLAKAVTLADGGVAHDIELTGLTIAQAMKLGYTGRNGEPPEYAMPKSYVDDLAPLVVETITNLLAFPSPVLPRYATVLSGDWMGQWIFCPDVDDPDNAQFIRRPGDVENDASPGRWVLLNFFRSITTFDPPSISAGGTTSTEVPVPGALLGSPAFAGLTTLTNQSLLVSAQVSTNGVVTVLFFNPTGSPVDLGSGTLRTSVFRH